MRKQPLDTSARYRYYTTMNFEFDPNKSDTNKQKHGIDFVRAQQLWTDPKRVEFVAQIKDEERYGIIALYQHKLWCAIYTMHKERVRLISVRRARKNEKDIYNHS